MTNYYLHSKGGEYMGLLELILALVLLSWIGGFAFNVGGDLIHLLLIVAVVMFFARLFRRSTI